MTHSSDDIDDHRERLWIALTDDWELRGNGLGSVHELQHRPALRLMDLYESLGIVGTFNAEVGQQLAFERFAGRFAQIREQRDLWNETLRTMKRRGFDVQLHIHPQWHEATFDGRFWKLDRRWNIASYPPETIEALIGGATSYLRSVLGDSHAAVSFRGGSWGICCPSGPLFRALERHGIKMDISIVNGVRYDGESIRLDYTQVESPHLPYYPDYEDARKVADRERAIVEIPTQTFPQRDGRRSFSRRLLGRMRRLLSGPPTPSVAAGDVPDFVVRDPFGFESGRGSHSEVICDLSADLDPRTFEDGITHIVERGLARRNGGIVPLVLENHTKDLQSPDDFRRIERVLRYLRRRFGSCVRFVTLSEIAHNLARVRPLTRDRLAGESSVE